jgi:hypothetical protein
MRRAGGQLRARNRETAIAEIIPALDRTCGTKIAQSTPACNHEVQKSKS